MELCLRLCGSLDGRGVRRGMDTCIYMAESLHCSPKTVTTLFIGYLSAVAAIVVQSLSPVQLCNFMEYSRPGSSVLHYLLRFMCIESVMPSNHLILCHSLLLSPSVFPSEGSFPMMWSQLFTKSGGQSIGASATVLPINIQSWLPIGLTGLISCLLFSR